eukprot:scaffold252566_cov18-Tisochrysis_lutea.AAC.3
MQAVKTLPASIKEKRIPRAEAPCIPFTKRNKKEVNGDQEGDTGYCDVFKTIGKKFGPIDLRCAKGASHMLSLFRCCPLDGIG